MKSPILTLLVILFGTALPSPATEPSSKPPPPILIAPGADDDPFKGAKNAPLLVLEFSDYQCPFCARHFRETLPLIDKDYIKPGTVKYIFRDFPLETIHPQAPKAHEAAHCAGEQGKYWEMHDRLFAGQKNFSRSELSRRAKEIEIDLARFDPCLDSGKHQPKVRKGIVDGRKAGVKATPTFLLVLRRRPDGEVVNTVTGIKGAPPYHEFKAAIDSLLSVPK